MQIRLQQVDWQYATPMRLSYRTKTHARTVQVELEDDGLIGRGEGLGVAYHGETVETIEAHLSRFMSVVSNQLTRAQLQELLPPGGARNALDCALWDLEAKRAGRRVWELLGVGGVHQLTTTYTFGIDSPDALAEAAARLREYSHLKLKMDGSSDIERVSAVRAARPDAVLVVDANQAWTMQQLRDFVWPLAALDVKLIEQPLAVGKDGELAGFDSPIPLCADESCQTSQSLSQVAGKYQVVNIKLDKTGGLTEAVDLARRARAAGLRLMVGCMGGSSLSMAPAFVVGQWCEFVDLDGPLLIKSDIAHPVRYSGSAMSAPETLLWG